MVYITPSKPDTFVSQQHLAQVVSWVWIAACSDMDSLLSAPLCKEKSKHEKITILREMRTILQLFMCFECVVVVFCQSLKKNIFSFCEISWNIKGF